MAAPVAAALGDVAKRHGGRRATPRKGHRRFLAMADR